MTLSAHSLVKLCKSNTLGTGLTAAVAADYGFQKCKTEQDQVQLFQLYKALTSFPNFAVEKLHLNCIEGTLGEYISFMFSKNKHRNVECFKWFQQNSEVVKNSYPLGDSEEESDDDFVADNETDEESEEYESEEEAEDDNEPVAGSDEEEAESDFEGTDGDDDEDDSDELESEEDEDEDEEEE